MGFEVLLGALLPLLPELVEYVPSTIRAVSGIVKALIADDRTPQEYRDILAQDDVALADRVARVVALASTVQPLPDDYDPSQARTRYATPPPTTVRGS